MRLENKDATNEIVLTFGDDPDAATGAKFVGDTEPCRLRLSPGVIEIFAVKPGSKIGYIRSGGAGTEAELEIIEAGNQDSGTPQ